MTDAVGHTATGKTRENAKEIFQDFLDRFSEAVLDYDERSLCAMVNLPTRMTTQNAETVFETEAQWLEFNKRICRSLQSLGVNHYIRLVQGAEYLSKNYIEGIYDTHSLRNALPMAPSYSNRSTLVRVDGQWRLGMMETELTNTSFPFSTPRLDPAERSALQLSGWEDDPRKGSSPPLAIYQRHLDAHSAADMAGDLDAWLDLLDYPHTLHTYAGDALVETREDSIRNFKLFHEQAASLGVDRFVRTASRAEFLSPTRICGYHEMTVYSGDKPVLGPLPSRIILNRTGTKWRAASFSSTRKDIVFFTQDTPPDAELVSLREISERTTKK